LDSGVFTSWVTFWVSGFIYFLLQPYSFFYIFPHSSYCFSVVETREVVEKKRTNHEVIERADKATQTDSGLDGYPIPPGPQTPILEENLNDWEKEGGTDRSAAFFGDEAPKDG